LPPTGPTSPRSPSGSTICRTKVGGFACDFVVTWLTATTTQRAALQRFISLPDPAYTLPTTPAAVVTAPQTLSVIHTGRSPGHEPAPLVGGVVTARLHLWYFTHPVLGRAALLMACVQGLAIVAVCAAPQAAASTNSMVLNWTGLRDTYGVPIGDYDLAIPSLRDQIAATAPDLGVWIRPRGRPG
jgi:hypothetical protein